MNVFSGSRRIALVFGALWFIGWLVAAALHETKVVARYDFVVGSDFANFAGFDMYSCPEKTEQRSLEIKTESGRRIRVTFCIFPSGFNLPEGFVLDDPTSLVQNPFYKYADLDTKRRLFNTHVAQHPSYISANAATKKAIREKFGITENQSKESIAAPFDPDAYLAQRKAESELRSASSEEIRALRRLAELEAKAAGKTTPTATDESGFKIRKEDDSRLNDKWWESWRSAYGQGLAAMLGGLIALWGFTLAMGWIVRGFLDIPLRQDSKQ